MMRQEDPFWRRGDGLNSGVKTFFCGKERRKLPPRKKSEVTMKSDWATDCFNMEVSSGNGARNGSSRCSGSAYQMRAGSNTMTMRVTVPARKVIWRSTERLSRGSTSKAKNIGRQT